MSKKLKVYNNIILDNNINITDFNALNNELLLKRLEELNSNEPPKIFKNKHKKWEKEKELLNNEINKSFNNLYDNYKNIENAIK